MNGRSIISVVLVVIICLIVATPLPVCGRHIGKCQEARKERWVLHEGDRLDFQEWCHHEEPGDIEPEPPIGFVIPMRPGQTLKLRARRWEQGVRIQCGKPCFNWGNDCEWAGGDMPKGSVFVVECHSGKRDGPFPWP